jgi:hypothetical protein
VPEPFPFTWSRKSVPIPGRIFRGKPKVALPENAPA